MSETSAEMPKVKLVPEMYALKIDTVRQNLNSGRVTLTFENDSYAPMETSIYKLHAEPRAGDYYVVTPIGVCILTEYQYQVLAKI